MDVFTCLLRVRRIKKFLNGIYAVAYEMRIDLGPDCLQFELQHIGFQAKKLRPHPVKTPEPSACQRNYK